MKITTGADERIRFVIREQAFERSIEDLRKKGGTASEAAAKAEVFIGAVVSGRGDGGREKFRFTRKGEYRIRYCRKVDLGCGYRIVCIQKGQRLVLLYIGTHDDCFRWIDRHRTAEYDMASVAESAWMDVGGVRADEGPSNELICKEDRFAEAYEETLMSRIDDAVLRKVFAGIVNGRACSSGMPR